MNKKGQLGIIEFKFLIIGFVVGIILAMLFVYLANNGIIPLKMAFLCPGK
jgi:uncharacterized membrane protein